jgi:hypothetical protein
MRAAGSKGELTMAITITAFAPEAEAEIIQDWQ